MKSPMRKTWRSIYVALFAGAALVGCGEDEASGGSGTLVVAVSAEDAVRTGYPVDPGTAGEISFSDGWTVQFTKHLVGIQDFKVESSDGASSTVVSAPFLVELHGGTMDPEAMRFTNVPARRWDRISYRIAVPTAASTLVNGATAAERDAMITAGHTFVLRGTATKGAQTFNFDFGFTQRLHNEQCVSGDETDGVVVANGSSTLAQITLHLDHLFFDSLAADEPNLRFDAMAASVPDTGTTITLATLATQSLTNLRGLGGGPLVDGAGAPIVYDPGSTVLSAQNLREFVIANQVTVGHWNGEGHCEYTIE